MFIFNPRETDRLVPRETDALGILRPINPLMGYREGWSEQQSTWYLSGVNSEGWSEPQHTWFLGGIDDGFSPMIRSDIATPTVDMTSPNQFAIPALNGGLGAVQDAISVLAVVDLLTRG